MLRTKSKNQQIEQGSQILLKFQFRYQVTVEYVPGSEPILYSVQVTRWLSLVSPNLCQPACTGWIPITYHYRKHR